MMGRFYYRSSRLRLFILSCISVMFVLSIVSYAVFGVTGVYISLAVTSILAIILSNILVTIYIVSTFEDNFKESSYFSKKQFVKLLSESDHLPSGIVRVFDNQAQLFSEYRSIVTEAKEHIDVLGSNLASLTWMPEFRSATTEAANKGVKIRVLILDPESESMNLLAKQEGRVLESYRSEWEESLKIWQSIIKKVEYKVGTDSIQIRLYDQLPRSFLLIVDDHLLFRPYLFSAPYSSPCFLVEGRSRVLYKAYEYDFIRLWEISRKLTGHIRRDSDGP